MTEPERGGGCLRQALPAVTAGLPAFLPAQRWFGHKERAVLGVEIRDTAVVPDSSETLLTVIDVDVGEAAPVSYFLPLSVNDPTASGSPGAIVARHGGLVVRDAIADPAACRALLRGMLAGRSLPTERGGRFLFQPVRRAADGETGTLDARAVAGLTVRHVGVEQSNSSVVFGTAFILKALRRLTSGVNPEIEVLRFLGEHTTFDRAPALVGWAEYQAPGGSAAPVGVLQRFVTNEGDGWDYVLRRASGVGDQASATLPGDLAALGRTLAKLHLALASRPDVPEFAPEPVGEADARQWQVRTRASLDAVLARLAGGLEGAVPEGAGWSAADGGLGAAVRAGAERLRAAIEGFGVLAASGVVKTRHHGDFHLGQTLVAPDGWLIIDFEGEPLRPLAERRAKQTPLRDLAGLLRSLDYARATVERQGGRPSRALDELFAQCRRATLSAYVATVRASGAPLVPASPDDLARALLALEVEKALYELTYELGNRPDWVAIPLAALARLAGAG